MEIPSREDQMQSRACAARRNEIPQRFSEDGHVEMLYNRATGCVYSHLNKHALLDSSEPSMPTWVSVPHFSVGSAAAATPSYTKFLLFVERH
jgi:hypothetical protein